MKKFFMVFAAAVLLTAGSKILTVSAQEKVADDTVMKAVDMTNETVNDVMASGNEVVNGVNMNEALNDVMDDMGNAVTDDANTY